MSGQVLQLRVSGPHEAPQTYTFAAASDRRLLIGRGGGVDLALRTESCSLRHAEISLGGAHCSITCFGYGPTLVNNRRLDSPNTRPLETGDVILIGDVTMEVLAVPGEEITAERLAFPIDPVEAELIANIVGSDRESRAVYADWLEGQGRLAQAEFLRLEEALAAPDGDDLQLGGERRRELAAQIDVQWRRKVARPAIEHCATRRCPRTWDALVRVGRSRVRRCGTCSLDVHYCLDVLAAREHTSRGRPVAIDAAALRWPSDLAGPYGPNPSGCSWCDIDLGPTPPVVCPRCRQHTRRGGT